MKKLLIIALCGASFLTVVYVSPVSEASAEGQASAEVIPEDDSNSFGSDQPTEQSLVDGKLAGQPQDVVTGPVQNQLNPWIFDNEGDGGAGEPNALNNGEQDSTVEATDQPQNGNNVDDPAQVENRDLNRGSASGLPDPTATPPKSIIVSKTEEEKEARRKEIAARRKAKIAVLREAEAKVEALRAEAEAEAAEGRQPPKIEEAGNLLSKEELDALIRSQGKRSTPEVYFDLGGATKSKEIPARGDEEEYVPNPKELENQSQNQYVPNPEELENQSKLLSEKIKELKTKIKDTSWWKFRTKSGDRKLLSELEDEQKKLSENPEDTLEPDEEPQGMEAGKGLLGEIEKIEKKIKDTFWWKFRTKAENRKLLSEAQDALQKRNEYLSKNFITRADQKERFEGDINLLQRNIEELKDYRDGTLSEERSSNERSLKRVLKKEEKAELQGQELANMDKNEPEYQSQQAAYDKEMKELDGYKKFYTGKIAEVKEKINRISDYMKMNDQERAEALIGAVNKEVGQLTEAFNPEDLSFSQLNVLIEKFQNFADILNKGQVTREMSLSDQREASLENINKFLEFLENERDKAIPSDVDKVSTTSERSDDLGDLINSQKKLMSLRKIISERIEKFSGSPEKQEELKSTLKAIDEKQNRLVEAQIDASNVRVKKLAAEVKEFRTNYENGTRTESEFKNLEKKLLNSINFFLPESIDLFTEQKNLLGENNANYDQKIEAIKKIKQETETALNQLRETNPDWFDEWYRYFKRRRLRKTFGTLQKGPAPQTGSLADWNRLTQKGKENLTPDELQAYKDTISKELNQQQQSEGVEKKQQGLLSKIRNWFRSKPKTRQDIVNEINHRLISMGAGDKVSDEDAMSALNSLTPTQRVNLSPEAFKKYDTASNNKNSDIHIKVGRQDTPSFLNKREPLQQQPQKPTFWSRLPNIFRSEPKTGEEVLGLPRYEPVEEPASEPDSEGSTGSALEDGTELGRLFKGININQFIGGPSGTTEH